MTLIISERGCNVSEKNCDDHNRFRSRTIGFRVSPEEEKQINVAVSLSGLSKQDFIVAKLTNRDIYVQASCKVHRAVYDKLDEVLEELKRLDSTSQLNDELQSDITLITNFVTSLYTSGQ